MRKGIEDGLARMHMRKGIEDGLARMHVCARAYLMNSKSSVSWCTLKPVDGSVSGLGFGSRFASGWSQGLRWGQGSVKAGRLERARSLAQPMRVEELNNRAKPGTGSGSGSGLIHAPMRVEELDHCAKPGVQPADQLVLYRPEAGDLLTACREQCVAEEERRALLELGVMRRESLGVRRPALDALGRLRVGTPAALPVLRPLVVLMAAPRQKELAIDPMIA